MEGEGKEWRKEGAGKEVGGRMNTIKFDVGPYPIGTTKRGEKRVVLLYQCWRRYTMGRTKYRK